MPSSELSPEKKAALRDVTSQIRSLRGRAADVLYELGVLLRRVEAATPCSGEVAPSFKQVPLGEQRAFAASLEQGMLGEMEG